MWCSRRCRSPSHTHLPCIYHATTLSLCCRCLPLHKPNSSHQTIPHNSWWLNKNCITWFFQTFPLVGAEQKCSRSLPSFKVGLLKRLHLHSSNPMYPKQSDRICNKQNKKRRSTLWFQQPAETKAKGKGSENAALEADRKNQQVAQLLCHAGCDLHSCWLAVKCHPVPTILPM